MCFETGNLSSSSKATEATYFTWSKSKSISYTLGYSAMIFRGYWVTSTSSSGSLLNLKSPLTPKLLKLDQTVGGLSLAASS
jgi:hypothetical protein